MHFLRVNVTFYEAVNVIHDVISRANPFPYTFHIQNLSLSELETIKLYKSDVER